MTQYINKDALVAEIKSLRRISFTNFDEGVNATVQTLLEILDTLEAKEVDLETELNDYGYHYDYVSLADRKELVDFAKHFFELGLKAQKS